MALAACTFSLHEVVDADAGSDDASTPPAETLDARSGADADADGPGGGLDAEAGPQPRFCTLRPDALFCADFDVPGSFGSDWSELTPPDPPSRTRAVDPSDSVSAPASARFTTGAIPDGGATTNAALARLTPEVVSFTLSFDVKIGKLAAGDSLVLTYVGHGQETSDLFLAIVTLDGNDTTMTMFEEGAVSAPSRGCSDSPTLGEWTHVSIRVDSPDDDPAHLVIELTKPGGSPTVVLDSDLGNEWTPGPPTFQVGIPFASSSVQEKEVRVDNVVVVEN